ncbi:hypothetical protein A5320_19130 [Rheinheimera sp. SA_1]|uniref:tetratricopeptide repeat protein n=1 Tax=Rheinheimera sp. SA_1 TaxID=1827365 RepID=UPI0008005C8F|nr:tetratricopeptide repeat protein [Rheinheimera sp. SA_1]OBP13418.1 hypothetical protein A5320_19130 [Rheinheimera sp. SA_1]
MKCMHFRSWALCWLTFFSSLALASSSASLNKLEALIRQQEHPAAWQLAQQLQPEQEGDPRFDYLFGLAARSSGHVHQAVFALERALSSQPQSSDIRLALAVSYFDLGNLPAAERELKQLEKAALPDRAAMLVQTYLQRIEKLSNPEQGYWQNWLQLGAGSDSNPNSGVDEDFFFIPLLGQVRLFEQSQERDSSFYEMQAQLNFTLPQDQHSAFYLSAGALHSEYSEDVVFSRTYASAVAGYQTRWRGYQLAGELFYRPIQLDGSSYLDYQGLKTTVSYPIWEKSAVGLDLTYARQSYTELSAQDKKQLLAEGWLSTRTGRAEHKFQLRWGMDDSDQTRTDFNSRDYYGLGYRWQLLLNERWTSSVTLDYLSGAYDELHPLFRLVRDDSYYRAELELSYSFSPQWRALASVSHLRNNSNITIYQYQRTRGWVGVRYVF